MHVEIMNDTLSKISEKEKKKLKQKQKHEAKKIAKEKEKRNKSLLFPTKSKNAKVSVKKRQEVEPKIYRPFVIVNLNEEFPALGEAQKGLKYPDTFNHTSTPEIHIPSCSENLVSTNFAGVPLNDNENKIEKCIGEIHRKKLTKLKEEILNNKRENKSSCILNYCDNKVTGELNEAVKKLILKAVDSQEKLYQSNSDTKLQYVVGFHETKKYLKTDNIKLILIASDLKIYGYEDKLFKIVSELVQISKQNSATYMFALKRSVLGKLTLKYVPVSCIGFLHLEGVEEEFENVVNIVQQSDISSDLYSKCNMVA